LVDARGIAMLCAVTGEPETAADITACLKGRMA
jgi:hypothetical protein